MEARVNRDPYQEEKRDESKNKRTSGRLITRRRVLIAGGAAVASGALATGGFLIYDRRRRFGRSANLVIRDHRVELPASVPKMVIARGTDPALNVRAAIDRMGGMTRFINAEDVVVIKPNIGWDRNVAQAANTHPDVVAEVARACLEVGPRRVIVCDCPINKARRAFERSGILQAAIEAGAEVIMPDESTFNTVQLSERLGTWDVLEPFVAATKLINVPVAKHHRLTGTTAGMKNWIGITNKLRVMFHTDLQRTIAELSALMRPTLTVVDASRVLMDTGPEGGSLSHVKQVQTVAVGVDPVAMDAWAFSLFGAMPGELPEFLSLAEDMGLGHADFNAMSPVTIVTDQIPG
jgi:uncharacterized protein (DUF362 family)